MSNIGTIQLEIEELGREIFALIDRDKGGYNAFGSKISMDA